MNNKFHSSMLCSLSVLLAACGSGSDTATHASAQAPALAARVQSSAQADSTAYYTAVQQIYVGYFGRPADPAGLVYYANFFRSAGAPTDIVALSAAYQTNPTVRALIDSFGTSAESAALYPGDNGAFLDAVYQNLFAHAADAAGKAYWLNLLNAGAVTRASAAVNLMAGAQGTDVTALNNKVVVAGQFTTTASTPAGMLAYDGLAANAIVRAMLNTVNLNTNVAAIQPTLDNTLSAVVVARPAAGMYAGAFNPNSQLNTLVLDDDSYYGFYSFDATVPIAATGMLYGSGKSNSGTFTSSSLFDYNPNGTHFTLSAAYRAQASFNGNLVTSGGNSLPFTSNVIDPAIYDYNKPAALADVAGSWNMRQTATAAQAITILADGSFTGSSTGCAISGQLTPRGNKNVFNALVNYGPGTCPLSGSSIGGVAFTYVLNAGVTRQLYIAGTNASHSVGALMIGSNALVVGQPTALIITDTVAGTGAVAIAGKTITVKYTGYLYDPSAVNLRGAIFDSSDYHSPSTFSFVLGTGVVIPGWDQGFNGMKVGGKRTLTIPASLGYGATGSGTLIPPNTGLIFDVELDAVL